MTKTFSLEDEIHAVGDMDCPACPMEYPERCLCGGLMHASGETDDESETILVTRCDRCGRSVEDRDDEAA